MNLVFPDLWKNVLIFIDIPSEHSAERRGVQDVVDLGKMSNDYVVARPTHWIL